MNHRSIKINLFLATAFLLFSFIRVQAQTNTPHYNTSIAPNTDGFYEYLPQGYSSGGSTLYPLIIQIHGMGEYGNGSTTQLISATKHGVPREIKLGTFPTSFTSDGKTFKFIVLTPQWKSQASPSEVNAVIDYALSHYKVDARRIYLTGLSAGGGVVEEAVSNATVGKRIAAVVEFCGTSTPSATKAATIVNNGVAFWGIHNQYDNIVSSSKTVNWIADILAVKSTAPVIKTIPTGTDHNVWTARYLASWRTYGFNIYEWMLKFQRGTSTTTTNAAPVANAGSDKSITLPTASVTLSGGGTDADGSIAKYSWTKTAGPATFTLNSATIASPVLSALIAGTYTFRLTVTDNNGATDYDDINVTVQPALTGTTTYTVPGKVEAENYSTMSGIQTESTQDVNGGQDVGWIDLNDWMEYSVKAPASGSYTATFRVASGNTPSAFQVKNKSGSVLATVTVPATGGYQKWQDISKTLSLPSGTQTLRIVSTGSANWNINYINFISGATSATAPVATKIQAESYTSMSGVQKETTSDAGGGQDVTAIDNTDWMIYDITAPTAGSYKFTFRVASSTTGGQLQLIDANHAVLGTVTVPNTGGLQTWKDVTLNATLPAGAQQLIVYSNATPKWNFNYFTFAAGSVASTQAVTKVVTEESATTGAAITPNPFADRFVLSVNTTATGTMKVQLVDASGVVRKAFQTTKTVAGMQQTYLSASALPAGTYFVKVQIGDWSQTKQVVKL